MRKKGWVSNVKPVYSGFSALHSLVLWKCALAVANLTVGIAALINPAFAQSNIVPDNTLDSETSEVIPNIGATPNELITGGAQRGQNLFHSFREFNVAENRGAYFLVFDPSIQNILARVTGNNRSDILGVLGTIEINNGNVFRSNANLFLMNPNGIVFGENARLDINGSFYATTANEIRFGNQGNFSTVNPQAPRALTVNPSALFFDAVAKQGEIVNRSIDGLEVLPGRTLGLVGGNILIEGGTLFASSGRIELGSVASNSLVNIIPRDTAYSLSYEGINNFQDILLSQAASVRTTGNSGGAVQVQGKKIALIGGSGISANLTGNGIGGGLTVNASESVQVIGENAQADDVSGLRVQVLRTGTGKGGDMTINTPTLIVKDGAQISTGVFGAGKGGNLNINASESVQLSGVAPNVRLTSDSSSGVASGLYSETQGTGDAGNTTINTQELLLQDGAQVNVGSRNSGKGGNLTVNASKNVQLSGATKNDLFPSILSSRTTGLGNGGNITVNTPTLSVLDGARVVAGTGGAGKGGNLTVNASESVQLKGESTSGRFFIVSGLFTGTQGAGDAGDLTVNTRTLLVADGARIDANTSSSAKGGNLTINASEYVKLTGTSAIASASFFSGLYAESEGTGDGGNVIITTPILQIQNGAFINTNTSNAGKGGNIIVNASKEVELSGRFLNIIFSRINSQATPSATGQAGDLQINTSTLKLQDGAQISVGTFGAGKGGNLTVNAAKEVQLNGVLYDGETTTWSGLFSETRGSGDAGNIAIKTSILRVKDGARIDGSTRNEGNGGFITINASELVQVTGISAEKQQSSALLALANESSTGNAGNLTISTPILLVQDGGNIDASTFGSGKGGNLTVNASESLVIDGQRGIAGLLANSFGKGDAGVLTINVGALTINNDGYIATTAINSGKGGNLNVTASKLIEVIGRNSRLSTGTFGEGDAGNLNIITPVLIVSDVAQVNTSTLSSGKGGNLTVNASEFIKLISSTPDGKTSSGLFARANENSTGDAGDLIIKTPVLIIQDGARAETVTLGSGNAGNLTVDASKEVLLIGTTLPGILVGGLATSARQEGTGNAGNLTVNTPILLIKDGAQISTGSFGAGNGGTLTINASESVQVIGRGKTGLRRPSGLFSVTEQSGNAGNLNINTPILLVKDGGTVSAGSRGSGQGNTLTINASKEVQVINLGGLFTQAENTGDAGDLIINTPVLLVKDGGVVSASSSGKGRAGNVEIKTRILNIFDNATISTISLNQGQAGNINIGAEERLGAIDGSIFTASQESSGGGVNITSGDILLFGNSDISTFVVSGAGGGGDIKLTANSILAFGDSDIFTFAQDGKGGNITFDTPAFFGQNYRPAPPGTDPITLDRNNRVDINASGAVSGVIVLPDTSFVKNNLDELPEDAINTNALIANSCIARRNQQNGSFFVTGSGGLPARPNDAPLPSYSTGDVQPVSIQESTKLSTQKRRWQIGDPVLEPSGVYELPNGKLALGKEC